MTYLKFKYVIDRLVALILILILFPIILFISVLIKLKLGSPIFFTQERPGLKEKTFLLIKFRSMSIRKDEYGKLLKDKFRLTNFGKWLRETSLDEIPTLINILKGEMSFIGPRPLLVEYLKYYSNYEKKRHNVKPGLTGLAQIKGRNSISWKKKFKYDIFYIDNLSFILDMRIFFMTIFKVIKKEGINSQYNMPVEPFNGHKN
tara:strand:+ start:520 stop:1128 length:609 start_codon:yes stop_codon:yes gene_type:complete